MGTRHRSRELAMQALFYMDMNRQYSKEMLDRFRTTFIPSKIIPAFFSHLVQGVLNTRHEVDAMIIQFTNNWKMDRMSCVDRNILRIAVYELLFCPDIPPKVSINEAIEVGKKFGTEESGAFINGILDSIRLATEKDGGYKGSEEGMPGNKKSAAVDKEKQ
jgi:N utilization substance protein B